MRSVVGLLLLVALPHLVVAADPPAGWQVKHTVTLEQPATALAVGKTWAATGQADGAIRVWNLDTGKELAKLVPPGKPGAIRVLTGPADGTVLYGIEGDKSGFRWDWSQPNATRYARRAFEGRLLDVTPDGKQWAMFDDTGIKILAVDLLAADFKPKATLKIEFPGRVTEKLTDLQKMDRLNIRGCFVPDGGGFICRIHPAPAKDNARRDPFAEAEFPNKCWRWDNRGTLTYITRPAARALAFSPDGKLIATVGSEHEELTEDFQKLPSLYCETQLIADATGLIVDAIRPFSPYKPAGKFSESAVVFHPWSGALVSGGSDGRIRFWNVPELRKEPFLLKVKRWEAGLADRPWEAFAGHTGPVRAIAFTPNGLTLVSSGDDAKVLVWVPKP